MQKIYILVGPSGSGKTTLADTLVKQYGFGRLIGSTTRPIREGEIDGIDYHFIKPEQFTEKNFIEHATYAGNNYGMSAKEVDRALRRTVPNVTVMEITGAQRMRELLGKDAVKLIFILTDYAIAAPRMLKRGDSAESIEKRWDNAAAINELDNWRLCDYAVLNIDFQATINQILAIAETNMAGRIKSA